MMILADGTASLIARQASMPERLGIRMSSSTTSGARAGRERGALDAVAGLADDLDARLDAEQHGQAAPEQLLVVDHEHPDGLGLVSVASCGHRAHHGTTGRVRWHPCGSRNAGRGMARSGHPRRRERISSASPTSSEITP